MMNPSVEEEPQRRQWRYLPHDFPPWETVYGYFAKWEKEDVFAQLTGVLRRLLRQQEGQRGEPSACVIDAQSLKTSTSVPATSQGTDAGKNIVGRKRSIVTYTLGLLLAVLVTAASVQDSVAGTHVVDEVAAAHPAIRKSGSTAATASTSSSTPPPSASTWKSSNAPRGPGDSPRCPNAGPWSEPTGG